MPKQEHEEFGQELALFQNLVTAGKKIGVSHAFWETLASNPGSIADVAQFIVPRFLPATYKIETNYDVNGHVASTAKHIERGRGTRGIDFPVSGLGTHIIGVRLASFYRRRFSETTTMLKSLGFRHLNALELLAFGSTYSPYLFKGMTLVAGGSMTREDGENRLLSIRKSETGDGSNWTIGVEIVKVGSVAPDTLQFAVTEETGAAWFPRNQRAMTF